MASAPALSRRDPTAGGALFLLGIAVGAVGVLHVLQPDLSMVHQPFSFYVHGEHGWLLSLALATFAGAALAVSVALARRRICRTAAQWLIGFGLGMFIDAAFPSDRWFPWEGDYTIAGAIHASSAVVAPPLLLGAMLAIRRSHHAVLHRHSTSLGVLSLAYFVGLIACGASLGIGLIRDGSPPFIGLGERFLALAAVGWLALVAGALFKSPLSRAST